MKSILVGYGKSSYWVIVHIGSDSLKLENMEKSLTKNIIIINITYIQDEV